MATWNPTIEQVATILRGRTYIDGTVALDSGSEAGTFTTETRPTADQVTTTIEEAVADIEALFVGPVPIASEPAAARAAALRAAFMVELSYFPEQAEENSPYLQLRALAESAVSALLTATTVRELFTEMTETAAEEAAEEATP